MALVLFLLAPLGLVAGLYVYYARELPSATELLSRTKPFESTKIYDRNGELLYEILDPTGGRRTVVPIQSVPVHLIQATIAIEDESFYSNPGFSVPAIIRALWQAVTEKRIVSGASGITQQLVKNLFLSPEITMQRKIQEAFLAAELTRRYSKDTILEVYLNGIYYGNLAYGIAAAAETYFGKSVQQLTLAESALLAGLPQSPVEYDPYSDLETVRGRQAVVLRRMVEEGYISQQQAREALLEEPRFARPRIAMRAPHFVVHVISLLEKQYGTEVLYRGGLQIHTTLDLQLQTAAQRFAREHVERLANRHVTNAAIVAIEPRTGQILAMLGSVDFFSETIDGQVNVALRRRQPGSAIKPITYLTAFQKGWTAATMVLDVEQSFPDGANPPYRPGNHDEKIHGPVSVRGALANSYNIPAVATLHAVGIPAMLRNAHNLGITSLDRADYGLSLTLGGGEVTLLQLTSAYAAFANGGLRVNPIAILRIEDGKGNLIQGPPNPPWERVLDPRHAYLITSLLSDNEARTPGFGPNSALKLSVPAAAKTGTTNDYRDGWTVGYTPHLATGVWAGNNDNSPTDGVSGMQSAGAIWHDFMETALRNQPVLDFPRPSGLVTHEVCSVSGMLPSEDCPDTMTEIFVVGTEPTEPCAVHTWVRICRGSGLLATEFCPEGATEEKYYEVYPPAAAEWSEEHQILQPPRDYCTIHNFPPQLEITAPLSNQVVDAPMEIRGTVRVPDLNYYVVQYGIGQDPLAWTDIGQRTHVAVQDGLLVLWDARVESSGLHTLRIIAYDHHGAAAEARVTVHLEHPMSPTTQKTSTKPEFMPTVTPTRSPTSYGRPTKTPTPSLPALSTPTRALTATASPSPEPTVTQRQTETRQPPTVTLTLTPSVTPLLPPSTVTPLPSGTAVPPTRTAAPPAPSTPTAPAPTATPYPSSTPVPPTATVTQLPSATPIPSSTATLPALPTASATPSQTATATNATPEVTMVPTRTSLLSNEATATRTPTPSKTAPSTTSPTMTPSLTVTMQMGPEASPTPTTPPMAPSPSLTPRAPYP